MTDAWSAMAGLDWVGMVEVMGGKDAFLDMGKVRVRHCECKCNMLIVRRARLDTPNQTSKPPTIRTSERRWDGYSHVGLHC